MYYTSSSSSVRTSPSLSSTSVGDTTDVPGGLTDSCTVAADIVSLSRSEEYDKNRFAKTQQNLIEDITSGLFGENKRRESTLSAPDSLRKRYRVDKGSAATRFQDHYSQSIQPKYQKQYKEENRQRNVDTSEDRKSLDNRESESDSSDNEVAACGDKVLSIKEKSYRNKTSSSKLTLSETIVSTAAVSGSDGNNKFSSIQKGQDLEPSLNQNNLGNTSLASLKSRSLSLLAPSSHPAAVSSASSMREGTVEVNSTSSNNNSNNIHSYSFTASSTKPKYLHSSSSSSPSTSLLTATASSSHPLATPSASKLNASPTVATSSLPSVTKSVPFNLDASTSLATKSTTPASSAESSSHSTKTKSLTSSSASSLFDSLLNNDKTTLRGRRDIDLADSSMVDCGQQQSQQQQQPSIVAAYSLKSFEDVEPVGREHLKGSGEENNGWSLKPISPPLPDAGRENSSAKSSSLHQRFFPRRYEGWNSNEDDDDDVKNLNVDETEKHGKFFDVDILKTLQLAKVN